MTDKEQLIKTESQFQAMCNLSDMQMETLNEQEQTIIELKKSLELIAYIIEAQDLDATIKACDDFVNAVLECIL